MTILPTLFRALPTPLVNALDDDTAWLAVADVHAAIRLCLVQRDRRLTSVQAEEAEVLHLALERHSSNQHWRKNPVILSGSATSAGISHASLTLKTVGMADLLDGVKSDADRTFDYLNGALATLYRAVGGLIGERDEGLYYHASTLCQATRRLA